MALTRSHSSIRRLLEALPRGEPVETATLAAHGVSPQLAPAARYADAGHADFVEGRLQQYAGRLHREHADKSDVLIYDYVDTGNVMLERMWDKRLRGYRAMGYRIDTTQEKLC